MASTPMIRPLRPGFVEKAVEICRYRIAATKPAMARKISMESRKTCGLDSLCGSYCAPPVKPPSPKDLNHAIAKPRMLSAKKRQL